MTKRIILLLIISMLLAACGQNREGNGTNYAVGSFPQEQDGGVTDPRSEIMGRPDEEDDPSVDHPPVGAAGRVIFYNGPILTMNDAQPVAEAIAIEGSKIVVVGGQDKVFAYQTDDTILVDLAGRTLMPGFVDTHNHLITKEGLGGGLLEVQEQALAEGITTIADMGGARGEIIEQLREMEANGELRMRVSMYLNQVTACGEDFGYWYAGYPQSIESGALVHVTGVKIFLDGGSCNRIARSVGDPGDLYFSLGEVIQLISDIEDRGYQAAVHALGDRAIDQVLQAMGAVIGDSSNPMRHRIEHNASVRPDQIPLYNDIGPVATIFGEASACWWGWQNSSFAGGPVAGTEEWETPSRDLIEANPDIVFAWHEDSPVFSMDSSVHLWGFVTRKQINGDGSICEPPDWAADQTITVETALKVMTINGAYALYRENDVGSLEVGKYADMIVLSDNPLTIPADDLVNLVVLVTMVNGHVEYCAAGSEALCP